MCFNIDKKLLSCANFLVYCNNRILHVYLTMNDNKVERDVIVMLLRLIEASDVLLKAAVFIYERLAINQARK